MLGLLKKQPGNKLLELNEDGETVGSRDRSWQAIEVNARTLAFTLGETERQRRSRQRDDRIENRLSGTMAEVEDQIKDYCNHPA